MTEGLSGEVLDRRVEGDLLFAKVRLVEFGEIEHVLDCICKPDGGIEIAGPTAELEALEWRWTAPGFSGAVLELATGFER